MTDSCSCHGRERVPKAYQCSDSGKAMVRLALPGPRKAYTSLSKGGQYAQVNNPPLSVKRALRRGEKPKQCPDCRGAPYGSFGRRRACTTHGIRARQEDDSVAPTLYFHR